MLDIHLLSLPFQIRMHEGDMVITANDVPER